MEQSPREGGTPSSGRGRRMAGARTLTALRALVAILIILGCAIAYLAGMLPNALFLLLILMAPVTLLARLWDALRRRLEFGLVRHPLSRGSRPYLLQCLNRWVFWGMVGVTLALSIAPIQLEPDELL